MIDEIYIKPCFHYKGGHIIGAASDTNESAPNAFVFMFSSVMSK